MWQTTSWSVEVPLNSFELLVAGGALLICAAILLLVRRNSRVVLENSAVTEEFMAYMARIASGVENLQGQMPNSEAITRDVLLRLQEMAKAKPNGKVREMPGVFSER